MEFSGVDWWLSGKPQSPSLSNWIAALGIRKTPLEEPIGPFLSELPRICEDNRDLGVAHL
jgi:hypothetical protein